MKTPKLILILLLFVMAACSDNEDTQVEAETPAQASSTELQEIAKSPPEPEILKDQNKKFEAYTDQFLRHFWELHPGYAVYVGFYEFDNQLAVPNEELRALRRTFFVDQLAVLKTFDLIISSFWKHRVCYFQVL